MGDEVDVVGQVIMDDGVVGDIGDIGDIGDNCNVGDDVSVPGLMESRGREPFVLILFLKKWRF